MSLFVLLQELSYHYEENNVSHLFQLHEILRQFSWTTTMSHVDLVFYGASFSFNEGGDIIYTKKIVPLLLSDIA